jgi:hypothetical protein
VFTDIIVKLVVSTVTPSISKLTLNAEPVLE